MSSDRLDDRLAGAPEAGEGSPRLRVRILAGCLVAVAVVLSAELGLRVYHFFKAQMAYGSLPPIPERAMVPVDDAEIMFGFNPGWRGGGFTVNAFGMADRELSRAKPEDTFRIAFVGDSITGNFGHRPRGEIYLDVLVRSLDDERREGLRFESLNFGVNAYSMLQSMRTAATRVPRFEPDLIVAQLCLNDPYPSDTAYARHAPLHSFRLRNFLFRVLSPDRFRGYYDVDRNYDEQGWENVRRAFEGYAEIARQGTPVLVVLFPYLYEPAYEEWDYQAYHEGYRRAAEAAGVPFIDLLDEFRRAGLIDDRWPKDQVHPTAEGHALAARVVREELKRRGWLPD